MKKYFYIFAAAATCMLAACAKQVENAAEEAAPVKASGNVVFIQAKAGSDATKAEIDNSTAKFTWSAGDQIAVYANGYKLSDALAEGGTNSATFAFSGDNVLADEDRADFAVFPASLVFDGSTPTAVSESEHNAECFTLTLPGSYNLSEIQGDASPVPMIATNVSGAGLEFKHICALLRITVEAVPKSTSYITFDFHNNKVQGDFSIADVVVGTSTLETSETDPEYDDDIITVINDGVFSTFQDAITVNIPVPTGSYTFVTVTSYDATDHAINAITKSIKEVESVPATWTAARKSAHKVKASLPYFTSNLKTYKKVVFAPGNLQATITSRPTADGDDTAVGSAENWRFAEHQYDALGDCEGNRLAKNGADIDLFSWIGQSATYDYADDQKYGVLWPNNGADLLHVGTTHPEKIKYSWGDIFNGISYPADTWRLPNADKEGGEGSPEWTRLVSARNCSYVATKATLINGEDTVARGLIIFPDNYKHPYGVKELTNCGREKASSIHYAENVISLDEWNTLEKMGGCAFLPVTSNRIRSGGANVNINLGDAAYWGCYSTGTNFGCVMVACDAKVCNKSLEGNDKTSINPQKSSQRKNGCAVRLIRDVN